MNSYLKIAERAACVLVGVLLHSATVYATSPIETCAIRIRALSRIRIVDGDIARMDADVIVNAAHRRLTGGGGVDGAIHRMAGPELRQECLSLDECAVGNAVATNAYSIRARYVIHAVGPRWFGGDRGEDALLAATYRNALQLALSLKANTVIFPAISTGAFGFPIDRATRIAVREIGGFISERPHLTITIAAFADQILHAYQAELNR